MQIRISTSVGAQWNEVKEGFNEELFLALNPPFPRVKLLRFDGSKKGDLVSLQLNFIFFRQVWTSEIIEDTESSNSFQFIDVGLKLPFFLKAWRHRHEVLAKGSGSIIIDDISYSTGTWLTDVLMCPLLIGQFLYRKPIYKRVFN